VHGSNARNLSVSLSLISTSKTHFIFLIIAYVFSSTNLEKRAEQVLPGSEGVKGKGKGRGQEEEMTQTMYTHMNI
jgi:hypothetical protein